MRFYKTFTKVGVPRRLRLKVEADKLDVRMDDGILVIHGERRTNKQQCNGHIISLRSFLALGDSRLNYQTNYTN
jgi:hypothetical protein